MEESANRTKLLISRHRIGTDGDGVRTLVSFSGCPLNCRYCLNPELRDDTAEARWYTPKELLSELEKDRYYFLTTGGGVTFSGGEPLLHSDFIREFCTLEGMDWPVNIETCLNVPENSFDGLIPYIDTWIVDIKSFDPDIYFRYTGSRDLSRVLTNLARLGTESIGEYGRTVVVRIPEIPGFNTSKDIKKSCEILDELHDGFIPDIFEYVTDKDSLGEVEGRQICKVLKKIRRGLIRENGLQITQPVCRNKGNCPGTCPVCERELAEINTLLGKDGKYSDTEDRMGNIRAKYRHDRLQMIETHLMGVQMLPLLGDMKVPSDMSEELEKFKEPEEK